MSETVYYTGKLTKVANCSSLKVEDQAREILMSENETELETYYESWLEKLNDVHYGNYVVVDECLYHVIRQSKDVDDDIFQAEKNEDGSISFTVKYYNGGCSFNEAIEKATENL